MLLIPVLMRAAERLQFVDMPNERKVHSRAIPRIGGVAMVVGTMIPVAMWQEIDRSIAGFLLGVGVLFVFGVWDDRKDLDYRIKFAGQIAAILITVLYGGISFNEIPFVGVLPFNEFFTVVFTVLFLLGITNAINLSDGLDGLAGGMSLLTLGGLALIAYSVNSLEVALISITAIGSILGFLRFNTYPARIFMGDSGSQFLGFTVAVATIMLTEDHTFFVSPLLPIYMLILPIFDTWSVICQRLYNGKSPFAPDRNHLHHKLLMFGLDQYHVVFAIYVAQAFIALSAYYLRFETDTTLLILLVAILACLTLLVVYLSNNQKVEERKLVGTGLSRKLSSLYHRRKNFFLNLVNWVSFTLILFYCFVTVLFATKIKLDSLLLTLTIMAVLIISKIKQSPANVWINRAAVYTLCALVVYIEHVNGRNADWLEYTVNAIFVILAVSVITGFCISRNGEFKLTPLDFLVVVAAFIVPNMPDTIITGDIGAVIVKLVILFYSLELIISHLQSHMAKMQVLAMIVYGFVIVGYFL